MWIFGWYGWKLLILSQIQRGMFSMVAWYVSSAPSILFSYSVPFLNPIVPFSDPMRHPYSCALLSTHWFIVWPYQDMIRVDLTIPLGHIHISADARRVLHQILVINVGMGVVSWLSARGRGLNFQKCVSADMWTPLMFPSKPAKKIGL